MKLSTQVKLNNCFANIWFFAKFILVILVPLFLLVFAAPLFNAIRPLLVNISKPFVDSLVANKTTITSVNGILVGAFIPFIGTWAYNSSKNKGKNACYKKEVFYKPMLVDAEYIVRLWDNKEYHRIYRGSLSFWEKNRNTPASRCLNELLYNGFETLYCENEQRQKDEENLNAAVINVVFNEINVAGIDMTHQFLCRNVYDLLERNDQSALKGEIDTLFNRNKIDQKDRIDALCEMIMRHEDILHRRMNIESQISSFVADAKDMVDALNYLISNINKHYEAGTKLT